MLRDDVIGLVRPWPTLVLKLQPVFVFHGESFGVRVTNQPDGVRWIENIYTSLSLLSRTETDIPTQVCRSREHWRIDDVPGVCILGPPRLDKIPSDPVERVGRLIEIAHQVEAGINQISGLSWGWDLPEVPTYESLAADLKKVDDDILAGFDLSDRFVTLHEHLGGLYHITFNVPIDPNALGQPVTSVPTDQLVKHYDRTKRPIDQRAALMASQVARVMMQSLIDNGFKP